MSILTPFFNLFKVQKTDSYDIEHFNDNMDTIDTEMHRPPLTVNEIEPDPETRDIHISTVELADNLTSDEAQINSGTYIVRASGGDASIANGNAWLSSIRGEMVKTGYVPEVLDPSVTVGADHLSVEVDRDTFVSYVAASGTIVLNYTTEWSADPTLYGIEIDGTPENGDQITVVYVKENRGTISTTTPNTFISTGWNLYNHAAGYARVVHYSSEYGYMIDGTYTGVAFAETLSGEQTTITPVDGYFTIPADGFVFVTGGNDTDTMIWMTWSDWIDEPNGGTFEPYSQTSVDLSGVMVDFPDGLMRVGNYFDEINLNTLRAYSRIQKIEYTAENLAGVIASGVPYDTDTNWIYAVRIAPAVLTIDLSGEYTVSDHGIEMFIGTTVPVYATSLYGDDLKGKLRRDVVTISQQTLTEAQQAQVRANIGVYPYYERTRSNLNELTTAGTYYYTAGATGAPTAGAGRIDVIKSSVSAYGTQIATPNSNSPVIYVRSISPNVTGGFSTWTPVITDASNRDAFLYDNTASTTHVVHFPNNSRNLLISCGTGATTNIEIFIYCASNGTITYDEINKGGNVSYAVSTNTVTLTVGSAMGMTHRTVNVYGGKAYL